MRLQKHLNEITEPTVTPVKELITSAMPELYRILSKHNWNVTDEMVIKIFNGVFKKYDMKFDLSLRKVNVGRLIGWGQYETNNKTTLFVTPFKTSKYFQRFAKKGKYSDFFDIRKNEFLRNVCRVLAHEYIHAIQNYKSKGKFIIGYTGLDASTEAEYLSSHIELDPHAQDAAIEIKEIGTSKTLKRYENAFEPTDKPYKEFLKKLYFYIDKV